MATYRAFLKVGLAAALMTLAGCAQLGIPAAADKPKGAEASPPVLAEFLGDQAVRSAEDWRQRRTAILQEAFQEYVYGYFPDHLAALPRNTKVIDEAAYGGAARLEEWDLAILNMSARVEEATFAPAPNDANAADQSRLSRLQEQARGPRALADVSAAVIIPKDATGPVPVIMMQTFCGNHVSADHPGLSAPRVGHPDCTNRFVAPLIKAILGRYIATPPIEEIVKRGYALAIFYPGEIVPDSAKAGREMLARIAQSAPEEGADQWSAIGAWAWGYSRLAALLEADPRFDKDRIAAWGHSRHGKAALVAAEGRLWRV